METRIAENATVLNACLSAIEHGGSDLTKIADIAGVSRETAHLALDIMLADGVISSFGRIPRVTYLRAQ